MIIGNLDEKGAQNIVEKAEKSFLQNKKKFSIDDLIQMRCVKLQENVTSIYQQFLDDVQTNSAVSLFYEFG